MDFMSKDNIVLDKTYKFSVRIVKLYQFINATKKEFVLSKQILRSGTSIGANTEEAMGGISKKDFIAKLAISYKEARETFYWLRLLRESQILQKDEILKVEALNLELIKILSTIVKNLNRNDDSGP